MKKTIVGVLLVIAMVFGFTACHGAGHQSTDKTYAAVNSQTGLHDGEYAYVDVTVRNDHTAKIGVEISVNDGQTRAVPRFEVLAGQTYETIRIGDYENGVPIDPFDGPNLYVRIYNTWNNATIEWHVHENLTWVEA